MYIHSSENQQRVEYKDDNMVFKILLSLLSSPEHAWFVSMLMDTTVSLTVSKNRYRLICGFFGKHRYTCSAIQDVRIILGEIKTEFIYYLISDSYKGMKK